MDNRSSRIEDVSFRDRQDKRVADDHVVLRLSREALRSTPPAVRFVGRSDAGSLQDRLPWLA